MTKSILIIEDDLIIAENLKETLENLGYRIVGIASNAKVANDFFKNNPPDLCIVDIQLRGSSKNGIEIVNQQKKDHDIPFIYLTSMEDADVKEEAKKTNPAAYLIKPASVSQIEITLEVAINNHLKYQEARDNAVRDQYDNRKVIFVKYGDRYQRIAVGDIIYIKAAGTYSEIYSKTKKTIVSMPLKRVLDKLPTYNFFRTHKSFVVNESYIESFDSFHLYLQQQKEVVSIPISRGMKDNVNQRLNRMKV